MLGWLWRLIVGRFSSCEHQWDTVEKYSVDVFCDEENRIKTRTYEKYVLKCKKCGRYRCDKT